MLNIIRDLLNTLAIGAIIGSVITAIALSFIAVAVAPACF